MKMKMTTILLFCFYLIVYIGESQQSCLHKGCTLSSGIKAGELDRRIKGLLRDSEIQSNVLKIFTWNLAGDKEDWETRKTDVCENIKKINPEIFGLQHVTSIQLQDLKLCLSPYSVINTDDSENKNPIFYKRHFRLRLMTSGTIATSKSNTDFSAKPKFNTWAKLKYGQMKRRKCRRRPVKNKLLRLFQINTGKDAGTNSGYSTKMCTSYQWRALYIANIQLDDTDEKTATEEISNVMTELKDKILDRRRYPIIAMGDFGYEDDSIMYEAIMKKRWLDNTMDDSREILPALTYLSNENDKLSSYIFKNHVTSILSATVTDERMRGKHRPVVAAIIQY